MIILLELLQLGVLDAQSTLDRLDSAHRQCTHEGISNMLILAKMRQDEVTQYIKKVELEIFRFMIEND